ncbi:hypothetical protein AGMMS49974_10210 [Deltaproteobacteria bacterium]|nr:hypothetical protein AGMMS49974_10210 [Deltaproteobacteria bacterium]
MYVPPLLESAALRELRDFAVEGAAAEPSAPSLYMHVSVAALLLLPLLVRHVYGLVPCA